MYGRKYKTSRKSKRIHTAAETLLAKLSGMNTKYDGANLAKQHIKNAKIKTIHIGTNKIAKKAV